MQPPAEIAEQRPGPSHRNATITNAMLLRWRDLGRAGIEAAGGLTALARWEGIPPAVLNLYLRGDGSLTPRGEDQLYGNRDAGGFEGLARQRDISLVTLRRLLRGDGSLPQQGENRLNPGGNGNLPDTR
jgi:hypothetical protein